MSRNLSNHSCLCKHPESLHVINYSFTSNGCAGIYAYFKDGTVDWCQCKYFKLDNLKYLEKVYEQKNV